MAERGVTPERATEIERKYRVPDGARLPSLHELGPVSPVTIDRLVAEYFDTPELAVLAARRTLRRRLGGGDAGWHLKTPDEGEGRLELRLPPGDSHRVPEALRAELAEIVGDRPLLPVVSIRTERHTVRLFNQAGEPRLELSDDHVQAAVLRPGEHERQSWREVEVELGDGEPLATLDQAELLLLDAGLHPAEHASKVGRVLASVRPASRSGVQDRAAEAVLAAIGDRFGQFQAWEGPARLDEHDAVHQARVALRRLRSILSVFRALFDRGDGRRLREELRWAGERLGEPRDAEVLREKLDAELDALDQDGAVLVGPIRERLRTSLASRHTAAHARFVEALDTPRWGSLHAQLAAFLTEPPTTARGRRRAGPTLRELAGRSVERVESRYESALAHPDDLDRWHDVRKAAKAARYGYETLAALPGASDEDAAARRSWKTVATVFGEVQDAAILLDELASLAAAASAAGEPQDSYRELERRLVERRDAELARARAGLEQLLGG